MEQARQLLVDEVSRLPLEKVGKALSFLRYLEQEPEPVLLIDPVEENELHELLASGDFVSSSELKAKIEAMPND